MVRLDDKDIASIQKLRKQFPQFIKLKAIRSGDGGFVAEILSFPGCLTQGDTFSELVEMINDCVKTYLGIPRKYFSYMPTYLPSVKMAQDFDVFPVFEKSKELKMTILSYARAKS